MNTTPLFLSMSGVKWPDNHSTSLLWDADKGKKKFQQECEIWCTVVYYVQSATAQLNSLTRQQIFSFCPWPIHHHEADQSSMMAGSQSSVKKHELSLYIWIQLKTCNALQVQHASCLIMNFVPHCFLVNQTVNWDRLTKHAYLSPQIQSQSHCDEIHLPHSYFPFTILFTVKIFWTVIVKIFAETCTPKHLASCRKCYVTFV